MIFNFNIKYVKIVISINIKRSIYILLLYAKNILPEFIFNKAVSGVIKEKKILMFFSK